MLDNAQIQKVLEALQEAQFTMYALASALNNSANAITQAVKDAVIKITPV